jgi:hypothetical protein
VGNPYDPGHPVAFWLAILALVAGAYVGGKAVLTAGDCERQGLSQEWRWDPPRWECQVPLR